MNSEIGMRLHAARLVCGLPVMAEAATAAGMTKVQLHRFERGSATLNGSSLERLAAVYGVSKEYLDIGKPAAANDRIAQYVVSALRRLPGVDLAGDAPSRLRAIRITMGFESARSAARKNGWAAQTYVAHEAGVRPIPADRMISYALAFHATLDYALFGEGEIELDPTAVPAQWPLPPPNGDVGEPLVAETDLGWRWLRRTNGTGVTTLPLVIPSGSKFELAAGPGLAIPDFLIGRELPLHFGLVERSEERFTIRIINPKEAVGETVAAAPSGRVELRADDPSFEPVNLLKTKIGMDELVTLGSLVGTISFAP